MKKSIIALALMLCMGSVAVAGNVDTFGIGSKATALGGAFAAQADDPFAIYYNPAGLSQITEKQFSLGFLNLNPDLKVDGYTVTNGAGQSAFTNESFSDTSDDLLVPHMAYVQPLNDKMTLGVAFYVPFGLDIKWSEDPTQNAAAHNVTHSYYIREAVTPTISYKVSDKLSVGAGISIGKSLSGVERLLYNDANLAALASALGSTYFAACVADKDALNASGDVPTITACNKVYLLALTNNKKIKTELEDEMNFSYNFGVLYKPTDSMSFGLTYRSATDTEFEGTTEISGITKVDASTSVDHPEQIQFGAQLKPQQNLSLEIDVVYTRWSIIDSYTVEFDPSLLSSTPEKEYKRNWEDTRQLRIGVEYQMNDMIALRGGYFYDPSPIGDSHFDVEWPDADKKTYSLGAGINLGDWNIDLVYQMTVAEGKREISGESENMNETYEISKTSTTPAVPGDVSLEAEGSLIGYGLTVTRKF